MRRGSRLVTTCAAPVLSRMRAEPSVRIGCTVASTWDPPLRTLHAAIERLRRRLEHCDRIRASSSARNRASSSVPASDDS